MPPKMLVVIMEKFSLFIRNAITMKLRQKPATEMANLTTFPKRMPMMISLKILISKVVLIPRILIPIIVIMLLRPILTPMLPRLIGRTASIYENISIRLRDIMLNEMA